MFFTATTDHTQFLYKASMGVQECQVEYVVNASNLDDSELDDMLAIRKARREVVEGKVGTEAELFELLRS